MRKVVLLGAIILIWCGTADASYDGIADYWYSNDDGVILDSLASIALHRSNNNYYNKSSNLRTQRYNASDFHQDHSKHKEYLRTVTAPPFRRDDTLDRLQRTVTPAETWQCAIGPDKIMDDGCNHCVCLGGQIYLCTAKKCQSVDSGVLVFKTHREKQSDRCIEGERIKSFNCNRCWCSGGKILCTVRKCIPGSHKPKPGELYKERCTPGESLPSIDNCNTCGCNKRGQKYCTSMTCGIVPRNIGDKDVGCVPQTWYSLSGTGKCKECYCVDGKMGICYVKLCQGTLEPKTGYEPVKLMAAVEKSTCKKGAVMFDECSKCICTYKEEWRCYTRLIDKCSGQDIKPPKNKRPGGANGKTKPPHRWTPKIKTSLFVETTTSAMAHDDSVEDYEHIESVEADFEHNPEKGIKPTISPKTAMPEYESVISDTEDDDLNYEAETTTETNEHTREESYEINKTTHPVMFEEKDMQVEELLGGDGSDQDYPDAQEEIPIDSDISESDQTTVRQQQKHRERRPTQRSTKRRPNTTKRPNKSGRPDDSELPGGTQCREGESFTQGVSNNCQGCFCTAQGQWKCFSVKGACRETDRCWIGAYEKNKRIPCSYCHCGLNAYWMCFTDEACSQKLRKSSCDAVDCSHGCRKTRSIYGFCHKNKCVCV